MIEHAQELKTQNRAVEIEMARFRGTGATCVAPCPPFPLNPPRGTVRAVTVNMTLSKSEVERGALASACGRMKECQAAPGRFEREKYNDVRFYSE